MADQNMAQGDATGAAEKTISVPRATLPDCSAGDTYKVVSADDASVQLEHVPGDQGDEHEQFAQDMRDYMSPKSGGDMSGSLEKGTE